MGSDGLTPLGLAVREEKLDTIKYLIMECKVDVNGKLVTCAQYYYVKYRTSVNGKLYSTC